MQFKPISCPKCHSHSIKKNGISSNGKQRYRCNWCFRQFITDYTYQGCKPEIRNQIVPMTLNGSGIRDISRVLKVSINTVLKAIHQQAGKVTEPVTPSRITDLQLDEFWSYVGSKKNQCWLWYGFDPVKKKVVCFQLGRRTDENCEKMLAKLRGSQVLRFCTDDWDSYKKFLPETHHWIGKDLTQAIERQNLNFRTRLKKLHRETICFSKSDEMHYAVMKLYISHFNREHPL